MSLADAPTLSIVLPVHNEEELIDATIADLLKSVSTLGASCLSSGAGNFELVVVENGSSDATLRVALERAADDERVRVLSMARADYGEALVAGFRAATGSIVVNFDADYYDVDFISGALDLFEDPDITIVVASKRAAGSHDRRPLVRRALTWLFNSLLLNCLLRSEFGIPVSDVHGIKAMRRKELSDVVDECRMRGALFDVEMVVRANRAGLRVIEVPIEVVEKRPPRTSLLLRSFEGLVGPVQLRLLLNRETLASRTSRRAAGTPE